MPYHSSSEAGPDWVGHGGTGGLAWAVWLGFLLALASTSGAADFSAPTREKFEAQASELLSRLPPPRRIQVDGTEIRPREGPVERANFETLLREKAAGEWFAALVSLDATDPLAIRGRFRTWGGLMDYLQEREVLVEVWVQGEHGQHDQRRVGATELGEWRAAGQTRPLQVTVLRHETDSDAIVTNRLEFGFDAARIALGAMENHARHRRLQLAAQRILSARDEAGRWSAHAQWEALEAAVNAGEFPLREMPTEPGREREQERDLFLAFEFAPDEEGNFLEAIRVHRESGMARQVTNGLPVLLLYPQGRTNNLVATGFRRRGVSDEWEPIASPIPGRDSVEMRIHDPAESNPRRWHVLEFGEPELVRESALAGFSLLSAAVEHQRKLMAVRRANLALIAEPIIAAINVGGGIAGLGFPAGEAVRLGYNVVTARMLSSVPTVNQLRELFALMAARDRNPELRVKPDHFLSPEDLAELKREGQKLTTDQVKEYLDRVGERDLEAMVRLGRMGMYDERVTSFMNILTSTFKVTGVSDEPGWLGDVFNNIYFSMNGDVNLSTIFLVAVGQEQLTPRSGVSLESLANGTGPAEAWAQFFTFSVDVRAIANTVARWSKPDLARKELEKPFPYAPHMGDWAAYEFRAFGFPLLMFYKRGLTRADARAYETDYAYGLLGPRVVEEFPHREDLESEIRAGRMMPLGYVRVRDGRGGWKPSNLAVFAHRIPSGRHAGRTALIVYGLKAYRENSEYVRRALDRFRRFEEALRNGGVIEQVIATEAATATKAEELEPVIWPGATEIARRYRPLLSDLSELERVARKRAWGLGLGPDEAAQEVEIGTRLRARGVDLPPEGPSLAVDRFQSSFRYRERTPAGWREIQVVCLPNPADLERDRRAASVAVRTELARARVARGDAPAVVLLNEATGEDGRQEVGAPLHDDQGVIEGVGVLSEATAVNAFLDGLQQLPVADQARLRFNRFAPTLLTLVPPGRTKPERVFVTVEFAPGTVERERIHPQTGEREKLVFERGLWRRAITDRRILEIDYDADGIESTSRTYENTGDRGHPTPGVCLEETRTLSVWLRDLSQAGVDPHAPLIAKLRINRVTGEMTRETLGLFPLPVEVADAESVTQRRYDTVGAFVLGEVRDNEAPRTPGEDLEPLLKAVPGRPRFRLEAAQPPAGGGFQTAVRRTDLVHGLERIEVFDNTAFGRLIRQTLVDPFDGSRNFVTEVTREYAPGFLHGLVPMRTITRSVPEGVVLTTVEVTGYDPLTRGMTGVEEDYTGRRLTNTWSHRWESPVEIVSARRRTTAEFGLGGDTVNAVTVGRVSGEELSRVEGAFDRATRSYRLTRQPWHRPGVPRSLEKSSYSAFGRWMASEIGEQLLVRPLYDGAGREVSRDTFARNAASGAFDLRVRSEDDYRWSAGRRTARVRLWSDGRRRAEYRIETDEEGRLAADEIRTVGGAELRSVLDYEAETDRVLRVELRHGDRIRAIHESLAERADGGGGWLLPVRVTPHWGMISTNVHPLGDPFARWRTRTSENGDVARVLEWLPGTATPMVTELVDREGRAKERRILVPGSGTEAGVDPGIEFVARHQAGPENALELLDRTAYVAGTDVALFTEAAGFVIHSDLRTAHDSPRYRQDPAGRYGGNVRVDGVARTNVLTVFRTSIPPSAPAAAAGGEPRLILDSVDLRGGLSLATERRTFDRTGALLEVTRGTLPIPGSAEPDADALLDAAAAAVPRQRTVFHYEAGALVRRTDASATGSTARVAMVFERGAAPAAGGWPVNPPPWRDLPTSIEVMNLAPEAPGAAAGSGFRSQRWFAPRRVQSNPFIPDASGLWTEWSTTQSGAGGEVLSSSRTLLRVASDAGSSVTQKRTRKGSPALRTAYAFDLPGRGDWRPAGTNDATELDLAGTDFVGVAVESTDARGWTLQVRDQSGRIVSVDPGEGAGGVTNLVPAWPVESDQVVWMPGERDPVYGASLTVTPGMLARHAVRVVSVASLAAAGLEARRPVAFTIAVPGEGTNRTRIAGPFRFVNPGRPAMAGAAPDPGLASERHSSGFGVVVRSRLDRSGSVALMERLPTRSVTLQGTVVARVAAGPDPPYERMITVVDGSDPNGPRPLYTLGAEDNRFIRYHRTVATGDTGIFSGPSGFLTPKLELHEAGVLEDEISPGRVTFGYGHQVTLPLAIGGNGLSRALANLRNRCAASVFDVGAQALDDRLHGRDSRRSEFARLSLENGPASVQAEFINRMPTLAGGLLARRALPWDSLSQSNVTVASQGVPTNAFVDALRHSVAFTRTGLIPTQPGTAVDHLVDTVAEARLIKLAVLLRDPLNLPKGSELLRFYHEKTQGGSEPVQSSYDAFTGASLAANPRFRRPVDANANAVAQVALAEAAFCFGVATSERRVTDFGWKLLELLLAQYRPAAGEAAWPRGVTEQPARSPRDQGSVRLWSEPARYSLETNARLVLLLQRLERWSRAGVVEPRDRQAFAAAVAEQSAWLTNRILPRLELEGIAPNGIFELQDVPGRTRAEAFERWTSAEDWLTAIEAADVLGVPRDRCRAWLENLARVHGAVVGGTWGIDWSLPLLRSDAISPRLTARFARLAERLNHPRAASFARQQLERLRRNGRWPALVTDATASHALATGPDAWVFPAATGSPGIGANPWPEDLTTPLEFAAEDWPIGLRTGLAFEPRTTQMLDVTSILLTVAAFYLTLVGVTLFWWALHALRRRAADAGRGPGTGSLVSPQVMQRAEERWACRVIGVITPPHAEHARFSNGPVEQSFHMQLRAIYKLVLEYRRLANGWAENDRAMVSDDRDEWLNGLDEFCAFVGIYSRWVVKAGRKDGGPRADALAASEDSNHLWSRLVMYFSEFHLELLELVRKYKAAPAGGRTECAQQIAAVLKAAGIRTRFQSFDARLAFDAPGNPEALDLLPLQLPGATLDGIVDAIEARLGMPREHQTAFISKLQDFKAREDLYPIHPYLIELAKLLPHLTLMGLVALVWYNRDQGGLRIYPYLRETVLGLLQDPRSLFWGVPLGLGLLLTATAAALNVYRFRYKVRAHADSGMLLDATVTSFFTRDARPSEPAMHESRWLSPLRYRRLGWCLRAFGLVWLAGVLFGLETPTFAIFMFIKGFVAVGLFVEAAGIGVPLLASRCATWLEDHVAGSARPGRIACFLNGLNLVPTRPASLLALSMRYHFQPSVPTGGPWAVVQSMVFYVVFSAAFFFIGGYLYKQALQIWFLDTYRMGRDFRMLLGGGLFWTTMYLLRFGLFILLAGIASAWVTYPIRWTGALAALGYLVLHLFSNPIAPFLAAHGVATLAFMVAGLGLMVFEPEILAAARRLPPFPQIARRRERLLAGKLETLRADPDRALGVVYMSGDDLSYHKLTADLLMIRLRLLREKLGSTGLHLLSRLVPAGDDAALEAGFHELHDLERRHDVTLWQPDQLVVGETDGPFSAAPDLLLRVATEDQREALLATWHRRRWLVTMMSTAGHSQDTAINLVDIALRLRAERLAGNTVFYLIQNKYDNATNNRPAQLDYAAGELGQRHKLARLLMAAAPGCRAYSITNWTPFGFKAGGLVGMDLVHEESLRLTNMLILDRNANAHDLDAVMEDLTTALADPGVVIVIPGRGTTNTLTALGQASQCVEEGNRALLKGVMALGGAGGESLGTGWGNIQAVYYARVQRALCDPASPLMPLTSRTARGASFGERTTGLIGFGPHAVGISEDIWGVTQAAHNAIGLGLPVRFRRSRALWHKVRESWSHAEWFSAFPRWSGGYLQMMLDPIMQRINDRGPMSVFAKELRANGGRFFLSAPLALLTILLMPVAIIWEVSPFVRILILLWNFGLIMNQVLTGLGLLACLEATGFNRVAGLMGAATAGVLCRVNPALQHHAAAIVPLGLLAGGFIVGLGRWLHLRGRDMLLFGPQLVIHAVSQLVRQSLEFVLSGASADDARAVNIPFRAWVGPRESRPGERYASIVNLRTVVWGTGLGSLLLNLFALANLDFLNVLLLLPTLLFSVSCLAGPFLLAPTPGRHLGAAAAVPRLLGWLLGFAFYTAVAWGIARRGMMQWAAAVLFAATLTCLLKVGLRYLGYPRAVRRLTHRLRRQLAGAGLDGPTSERVARQIVQEAQGDAARTRRVLGTTSLSVERQAECARFVADTVAPLLGKPVTDLERHAGRSRFASEFGRSLVVSLLVLIWFAMVPVLGLLVFQAPGDYQFSVSLTGLRIFLATVMGAVLLAAMLSRLTEWWMVWGPAATSVSSRAARSWERFEALRHDVTRVRPHEVASVYALFTDLQTYVDQRSCAYASRTLRIIENRIATVAAGVPQTHGSV